MNVLLDHEIFDQVRAEVVWRSRDLGDRAVPSGVYFCRIEAGGYSDTKRMMLVK